MSYNFIFYVDIGTVEVQLAFFLCMLVYYANFTAYMPNLSWHIILVPLLVVDGQSKSVNDPVVVSDALALEKEVAAVAGVQSTLSYWSSGNQKTMVSKDGNAAYLLIYTKSDDFAKIGEVGKEIQKKFDGEFKSLRVYASGNGVITSAINGRISKDLALAETISIPLTFILLIFVFGALIASAMPLFVGIFSILGAFFLLFLITQFTTVSVFALNLVTGIGLGLGIDYSLLMVNRFREELHHGNMERR